MVNIYLSLILTILFIVFCLDYRHNKYFKFYLFGVCFPLSENYFLEIDLFRKIKMLREPSFNIDFDFYFHAKMDHCPKITFVFIFLWWKIIEVNFYNKNHC